MTEPNIFVVGVDMKHGEDEIPVYLTLDWPEGDGYYALEMLMRFDEHKEDITRALYDHLMLYQDAETVKRFELRQRKYEGEQE